MSTEFGYIFVAKLKYDNHILTSVQTGSMLLQRANNMSTPQTKIKLTVHIIGFHSYSQLNSVRNVYLGFSYFEN